MKNKITKTDLETSLTYALMTTLYGKKSTKKRLLAEKRISQKAKSMVFRNTLKEMEELIDTIESNKISKETSEKIGKIIYNALNRIKKLLKNNDR